MRVLLSVATVLFFVAGTALAADQQNQKQQQGQNHQQQATSTQGKSHLEKATITNVDPKKGTITVKMHGKNGKDVTRTFHLTEDVEYMDSTGRVARLDLFRSGDEVLVVEERGRLREVHQVTDHNRQNHPSGAATGNNGQRK